MIFSSTVPLNYSNRALIAEYLAKRFTYFDLDEWSRRIAAGKIAVNGLQCAGMEPVTPGDIISYDAGEFEEPPADLSYRVIFEDEWLLGIDKPGNLLVHRAGKSFRNNLIHQLRHVHSPMFPGAHPVHRLDRETSGVVIVAKDSKVCGDFGRKFSAGGIQKTYLAIVHGNPSPGEIDLPIGKKPDDISCRFCVDPAGKPSRTRIVESQPFCRDFSLATIQPLSGRTHQIRVHLAAIGHPIVGDRLYSSTSSDNDSERQLFPRQALHCRSLSFEHPYTGAPCTIDAPVRDDMMEFIERFANA